jgi:hypothetical protein
LILFNVITMKKIIYNKSLLLLTLLVSLAVTSCLKDKGFENGEYGAIRNTEGGKYIVLRAGGLNNVQKSNILIDPSSEDYDTVDVWIDLDLAEKTTSPQTVKIALDYAKVGEYNAANNKNFLTPTSEMVQLTATEITIPAGERVGKASLLIKQNLFDPVKSYMFPVTILEAPSASLSSNLNTRYYNIIGNPFAGPYLHDFTRYDNNTGTGTPSQFSYTEEPRTALPVTETTFSLPSGYYIEPDYQVSFTNTNGVYSNFKVVLNPAHVKLMKDGGVEVKDGPTVIKADPVNKEFIFQYLVQSSSGAYRYVIDRYYFQ